MKKQLDKLNEEIDAVAAKIHLDEAKRKRTPNVAEKAIILKSIDILNSRLEGLIATRGKFSDASTAAPIHAPGKNIILCMMCLFLLLPTLCD
jgi:hypothetical protein